MATTPRKTGTATPRKPAAARKAPARKPAASPRKVSAKAPAKARAKASPPARTAHSASMAALGTLAVAAIGGLAYGAWQLLRRPSEGTEPTDLEGDTHPDGSERAIDAFRPDPAAPVPASEREQFRPALAQLGNGVS